MQKNIRLNQELIYLKDKHSFQLKDLIEKFNISKRTALRDIEELENMGLALYAENGRGGGYRIISQNQLIPITITQNELEAIFYSLKALQKITQTPFDNDYPAIAEKLLSKLSKNQVERIKQTLAVIDYYNVTAVNHPRFLSEILSSIINEQVVMIHYTQNGEQDCQVQFFDLFFREGIWFCHGLQPQRSQWSIYRCDYITDLSIAHSVSGQPRSQLKQLLQEHERDFRYLPFRCRLTPGGKEKFLKSHYETMELVENENGIFLKGFYNPQELGYLIHYLIEFGKNLIIEEPASLKRLYVNELKKMIDQYKI